MAGRPPVKALFEQVRRTRPGAGPEYPEAGPEYPEAGPEYPEAGPFASLRARAARRVSGAPTPRGAPAAARRG
jgi:hypothetical protein